MIECKQNGGTYMKRVQKTRKHGKFSHYKKMEPFYYDIK
jgi:hypothetical protein